MNLFNKIKFTILYLVKHKHLSNIVAFAAGALGTIPYYCEPLFIFTFLSLIALFYLAITQRRVYNRVFMPFFMYFLGFYTPLYLFLSELYPYDRFGFSGSQAGLILVCSCILIPLLHASVEALVMKLSKYFPDNWMLIIGYSALWVIGEWVLTLGSLAFPWGNIAVSLTGCLPFLQTASLFGKYFITFITVAACVSLVYYVKSKDKLFAYISVTIVIINALTGTLLWFIPAEKDVVVNTAVVQGNVLSNEKWEAENADMIMNLYLSMANDAAEQGADLIVLPESAIPYAFRENGILHNEYAKICKKYNVTIITGINCVEHNAQYNSVIGILPNGELTNRYDKRHLVPFGEFIPLVDIIGKFVPFVAEFNADSGAYTQGKDPVIIDTEYGKIAPLVCFDSIFSKYSCEGAKNGGEIIALVTNDSWFNDSVGIYTHLRHSQLRSIETGKFIIRAANTGISAFINNNGEILEATEPLVKDMAIYNVPFIKNKTLYTYIGDIVLYLSFAAVIFLILLTIVKRCKNGNNKASLN